MTAAFAVALALALTHKTKRKMSPLGIENFPERWAIPATLWRREPIPANKTTSFCIILPFGAIYLCRTEKSKWQFELIFNVTTGSSSSCQLFIKPLCEPVSRTDWAIDKSRVWPGTQPRKQGEMQWSARYHSPLTRYPVASCQLPVGSHQAPGRWAVIEIWPEWVGKQSSWPGIFPHSLGKLWIYIIIIFLASLGRLGFNEALINCAACPFWRRREPRDLWSSTTFPALSLFARRLFRPSRKCLLKYYIWHNWNLCATIRGPKRKSHHVRVANEQKAE